MNASLGICLHFWRGIGPEREPDLFLIRWRLGFVTLSVCRVCVLDRYRKLRATMQEAVAIAERGDREGR